MVYSPQVVLVTGGAGFLGSNVLVHLCNKYPNVQFICYDKLDYSSNLKNFDELKSNDNFRFIKGDITDPNLLSTVIDQELVDTVMHFAAQTHVDASFGNSFEFTKSNVLGTHVLLETCKNRADKIKRFIHVSTDEVYGEVNKGEEAVKTTATMEPKNPYAATKAAAEFMVKSYRQSFKMPIIITRSNNVYGPKQFPEKLIPKFITLLNKRQPCPLHGDGSHHLTFLHVDDVCEAYDTILHQGQDGETYNIGANEDISVKGVLDSLLSTFGLTEESDKYTHNVEARTYKDLRFHIDSTSLRALGWAPKISFEDGIKTTKNWYVTHENYWGDVSSALSAHPVVSTHAGLPKSVSTFDLASKYNPAKRAKK